MTTYVYLCKFTEILQMRILEPCSLANLIVGMTNKRLLQYLLVYPPGETPVISINHHTIEAAEHKWVSETLQ